MATKKVKTRRRKDSLHYVGVGMDAELKAKCEDLAFKNNVSASHFASVMIRNGIILLENGYFDFNKEIVINKQEIPKKELAPLPEAKTLYVHENILYLRKAYGLSQKELSENINITRWNISSWEIKKHVPSVKSIEILSKFFNIPVETLLYTKLNVSSEDKE